MEGIILEAQSPEPERIACISTGIFRRELVHAGEPTESCILFVPGVSGDGERYDEIVEILNRAGFDVLRFGGWLGAADLSTLKVHDVLVALEDTLRIIHQRGYSYVGYLGKSLGGLFGLLSRGGYDRMALWAPAVSLGEPSDVNTRFSDLDRITDFSIAQDALRQKTWPILIVSGSKDEILDPETAAALVQSLPNGAGSEVQSGHSVDKTIETLERTLDFFTQ
jgi:hypothetical protein